MNTLSQKNKTTIKCFQHFFSSCFYQLPLATHNLKVTEYHGTRKNELEIAQILKVDHMKNMQLHFPNISQKKAYANIQSLFWL